MKKLIYYAGIMLIAVIILPMLIVKGCGRSPEKAPEMPEKQKTESIPITVRYGK